jgi:hypothetical protein
VLDVLRGGLIVGDGGTKYFPITVSRCCTFNNIAMMSRHDRGNLIIESSVDGINIQSWYYIM